MKRNENQPVTTWFFRQQLGRLFAGLLLVVCYVVGTAAVCLSQPAATLTNERLYRAAVIDAMTVEDDELLPLVTITPDSDMVTWRDGKILLMTFNRYPERYITGTTITLPSEVWTITDKELSAWYHRNKKGVTDWTLRFKQLVGVPPDKKYTHVTALWVSPKDVRRPAYSTDITTAEMVATLPEGTTDAYRAWFNSNIIWSYFDSAYPWTRLGYTYDWAADSGEYGLTEFWVRPNAKVEVEFTATIDAFVDKLEQRQGTGS